MISLKRYLDSTLDSSQLDLLTSLVDGYRSALTAMGVSAAKACPFVAQGLPQRLTALGQLLGEAADSEAVVNTGALVSQELQEWGDLAHTNLRQKTDNVKALLVALTRTAASIASNDSRYARRFDEFTARLEGIASLEDLAQVRTSLVRSAAELRSSVAQMSESTRTTLAQLQSDVATYQARLEEAEQLASRDTLTGLFSRSRIESDVERRIGLGRPFSVAMIDLDGFKQVNDQLGHAAGDELLKAFSTDLRSNARPEDLVGRWGGDEFVVVLDCARLEALAHIERIRKWVIGDYLLEAPGGRRKVHVNASIGLAAWAPGATMRQLIDQADGAMYKEKGARKGRPHPFSLVPSS